MRQTNGQASRSGVSGAPHASVSHADYAALAIAHVRANGGKGVVLTAPGQPAHQPAQWRAWMAYFGSLNANMARTYGALKQITAPTAWPLEFDLSAPASEMVRPTAGAPSPPPDRRRELAQQLRETAARATLRLPPNERRTYEQRRDPPEPKPFTLPLVEGQDAFADRPLTLTHLVDPLAPEGKTA